MKLFFVCLLAACLFAGCASEEKNDSSSQKQASSKAEIMDVLQEAQINTHYIAETPYQGDELQIVQTLNRLMKGIIDYDADAIRSAYVQEHPNQTEDLKKLLGVIVSLDNPRFNPLNDGNIEVFVEQKQITFGNDPLAVDETEKIYFMKKEGDDWRILSVAN